MLLFNSQINYQLSEKLFAALDWSKDLPEYIFRSRNYRFFMFERPITSYGDALTNLLDSNEKSCASDCFVSFGIPHSTDYAQYFFDDPDVELRMSALQNGFRDFFNSTVSYPILFTNMDLDWMAFESANEELGILAVRQNWSFSDRFIEHIDNEAFIDIEHTREGSQRFAGLHRCYGKLIPILSSNYA